MLSLMPPTHTPSDDILDILQKERFAIGTQRVHSPHAWSAIALVLMGAVLGVALVANRSGEIESVRAATTITAATCNQADVQSAINQAQSGDTVQVPAGSCSWTNGVVITKAIRLLASGAVTITDNYTAAADLVAITESSAGNIRISGFTWVKGTGPNTSYGNAVIGMNMGTNGKPILIDGNTFMMSTTGGSIRASTNRGVIWNNIFKGQIAAPGYSNNASALRHKGAPASSWKTAANYGTADTNGTANLYFENNTLNLLMEGIDVDDNARPVIRYNAIENSVVGHHGNDTSATGGRYSEIYNNTFVWNPAGGGLNIPPNNNGFIVLRGGSSLIHDNSIQNINSQAWGNK